MQKAKRQKGREGKKAKGNKAKGKKAKMQKGNKIQKRRTGRNWQKKATMLTLKNPKNAEKK